MIPGSNILRRATRLIAQSTVQYYRYWGRITNDIGLEVVSYLPAVELRGSLQAVQRNVNYTEGLYLQKNYFNFYCSQNILDLSRDVSNDQISFNGRDFQCQSISPWYHIDGWVNVLLVEIGLDFDRNIFGFNELSNDNNNQNFEQGNFVVDTP